MQYNDSLVDLELVPEIKPAEALNAESLSLQFTRIGFKARQEAESLSPIKEKKFKHHLHSHNPFKSLFEQMHEDTSNTSKHPEESTASLHHSAHHQQFEQVHNILDDSPYDDKEKRQILNFVEELLYRNETGLVKSSVTAILAKLVFLISARQPFSLTATNGIDKAFRASMKQLHATFKQSNPTPLNYQTELPFLIADCLVLKDGTINSRLIPFLIKELIPNTLSLQNYPLALKSGLQLIHQSTRIRERLEKIRIPPVERAGYAVVRNSLNLSHEAPLGDREAKIAVLSAFLTHLRQGVSGCCFASFIAIEQQAMHPDQVLEDLISLIEQDGLIRNVEDSQQHFPYLLPKRENDPLKHPLLKAWENAIAGMSEAKKGGMLKSALIKTVTYAYSKRAEKIKILPPGWQDGVREKIEQFIVERTQYLYDPDFISTGEIRQPGAFLLFETKNQTARRIDQAEVFQQFVKETILEALPPEARQFFEDYLNLKDTLKTLLKKYHTSNSVYLTNSSDLSVLPYMPWKTIIGNDPKMVYQVYSEAPTLLKTVEMKPSNAHELLSTLHNYFIHTPESFLDPLSPIRIQGLHTFSLLPHHDSLLPYFKKWVPLEDPQKYANLPILKSLEKKIYDWILSTLQSKESKVAFLDSVKNLDKAQNISDFRNQMLAIIKDFQYSETHYSSTKSKLDLLIFQSLPKKIQNELQHKIITIADSNWQEGTQDIHYGIGINPASGEFELLAVLDNGKLYKFLNQNTYFKNRTWELAV